VVVPQALVQILRDLTPAEQEAWLAAAGGSARTLGADPLFSREHNREQRLVLDRVRQDNGAVVQGPPTGWSRFGSRSSPTGAPPESRRT
jgi:hypothetical protein